MILLKTLMLLFYPYLVEFNVVKNEEYIKFLIEINGSSAIHLAIKMDFLKGFFC